MVYREGRKIDPSEDMEDEDNSGEETTLIPKSLLPDGVKVGDEVKLKVVHGYDGEFEVSYSNSHSNKNKSDSDTDKSENEESPQEKEAFEEISADA